MDRPSSIVRLLGIGLLAVLAPGCAGTSSGASAPASPGDQVAAGESLYEKRCTSCHTADGTAPKVMGADALPKDPPASAKMRSVPFRTVGDLLSWVQKKMPPGDAESLTPAEHAAVVAYLLSQSGVDLGGKVLDQQNATSIVMRP